MSECIIKDDGASFNFWPMEKVGKDGSKKSLI